MLAVESCKILVAGNCIFRRGMASIVHNVIPSALIAEAFCFADASVQLHCGEFFAAMFDIEADERNKPTSLRTLHADCPHLILAVLSRSTKSSDILNYLAAGVTGYILANSDQAEVERAVREILNGVIYVPPSAVEFAAGEPVTEPPASHRNSSRLTPRQHGVLRLLLKGYSNKEIARELNLSPYTVKIHVSALLRSFSVQKRSGLALAATAFCAEAIGPLASSPMLQMSA
jgi:DNA-binding NarL/FixJ family response regulator